MEEEMNTPFAIGGPPSKLPAPLSARLSEVFMN
jgi:hypothetical protein